MSGNILVISPTPSSPKTTGNRNRVFQLLSFLRESGYNIHFRLYNVFNNPNLVNDEDRRAMAQDWTSFEEIAADLEGQTRLVKLRRRLLNSKLYGNLAMRGFRLPINYEIDDWCCRNLVNSVRNTLQHAKFDAILVEYVYLSRVLTVAPAGMVKLIDTHDVFAERHKRLLKSGVRPGFFTVSEVAESNALRLADCVIAIQNYECEIFKRRLGDSVEVLCVPHLEPSKFVDREYPVLNSIGMLGSQNDVNINSALSLCDAIATRPALKDLQIYLGGSMCKAIRSSAPNVTLLGRVESLAEFYSKIDIAVNPTLDGTGLKIKSIEALSFGVPFMSTAPGTQGIDVIEPYHQFESVDQLVSKLEEVFVGKESLDSLKLASRECFERYSRNAAQQHQSLLSQLTQRTAKASHPEYKQGEKVEAVDTL